MKKFASLAIFFTSMMIFSWHCSKKVDPKNTTQAQLDSTHFKLVLDSTKLLNFLSKNDSLKKFSDQYLAFYQKRGFKYVWYDSNGLVQQAHKFYKLQSNVIDNLNDSSIFNAQLKSFYELQTNGQLSNKISDSIALNTELQLTGQFFNYSTKVYAGGMMDLKEMGWFIPRKQVDIVRTLDTMIHVLPQKSLEETEPLHIQYRLIEKYLVKYYQLKKEQSWDSIRMTRNYYRKGNKSRVIPLIKERLFLLGDLPANDSSRRFDSSLLAAVKQFQNRIGLKPNGIIGKSTMYELNKPIDSLIEKMVINLERARWMLPEKTNEPRIVVNIPEYALHFYDSGKHSFSMDVVVGTAANNTVIFNGNLRYIVFSPYWNVTEEIVKKEVLPAMKLDSNYLSRHNMEIVKYNKKQPVIRQKPGPNNSLGGVKFLFPNNYNIYFHDTPFKEAFAASKRTFSHGCIRLGHPARLAEYLLRKDTAITSDSIKALMSKTNETWMTAKPAIPVTIKYFTAWVDEKGLLNLRDDIYGHDKKMANKLFAKTAWVRN